MRSYWQILLYIPELYHFKILMYLERYQVMWKHPPTVNMWFSSNIKWTAGSSLNLLLFILKTWRARRKVLWESPMTCLTLIVFDIKLNLINSFVTKLVRNKRYKFSRISYLRNTTWSYGFSSFQFEDKR